MDGSKQGHSWVDTGSLWQWQSLKLDEWQCHFLAVFFVGGKNPARSLRV